MKKELFIGAIDLSPYFSECKKVRGGLEIRLKAVPWSLWEEFSVYFGYGYNGHGITNMLYIAFRDWEYNLPIYRIYHLGSIWNKGDYCLECWHNHGMTSYIKFDPIIPVSEESIYKIQNID